MHLGQNPDLRTHMCMCVFYIGSEMFCMYILPTLKSVNCGEEGKRITLAVPHSPMFHIDKFYIQLELSKTFTVNYCEDNT